MLYRDTLDTLPLNLYLAEQIQQGEQVCAQKLGIDMYQLMEQAGHAVFDCLLAHFHWAQSVCVLAGNGNNGGDAFVVARLAFQSGMPVTVYVEEPNRKLRGDAEIARQSYLGCGGGIAPFSRLQELDNSPDVVVDGLLGTGFKGVIRPNLAELVRIINSWATPVIAIDIPTGLNANTGHIKSECIKAQYTITFVALKFGLMTAHGPDSAGTLFFAGLGIDEYFAETYPPVCRLILPRTFASLPPRAINSNKGTYGHVVCLGGDKGMAGAIFMAAKAALRSGAGKVTVFTHSENVNIVTTLCPELMVYGFEPEGETQWLVNRVDNCDCIVLGPGVGQGDWGRRLFDLTIACQKQNHNPLVLDADGLNILSECYGAEGFSTQDGSNWVVTPHPLEAARILSCSVAAINQSRLESAKKISERFGALCVLKGVGSLVYSEQGSGLNCSGNPGMASAGTGDVLAGTIAGIVASRKELQNPLQINVEFAVYLHGLAGDFAAINGEIGIIATDLIDALPKAIHDCY